MALAAAGVLASLALISWSVLMRYVFNRPPAWVDDVVGFLLVGIVMLSAAQALRNGEHIGVDVLTSKLGPRARRWAEGFSLLAVLAVSAILIVNGWHAAMFSRTLGLLTEGQLELPAWMLQLLLPFGGILMGLVALESLLRLLLRERAPLSERK